MRFFRPGTRNSPGTDGVRPHAWSFEPGAGPEGCEAWNPVHAAEVNRIRAVAGAAFPQARGEAAWQGAHRRVANAAQKPRFFLQNLGFTRRSAGGVLLVCVRKQQLVEVDEVDMGPRATVATADLLPHVRTCPQTDARANGARGQGAETPACG